MQQGGHGRNGNVCPDQAQLLSDMTQSYGVAATASRGRDGSDRFQRHRSSPKPISVIDKPAPPIRRACRRALRLEIRPDPLRSSTLLPRLAAHSSRFLLARHGHGLSEGERRE